MALFWLPSALYGVASEFRKAVRERQADWAATHEDSTDEGAESEGSEGSESSEAGTRGGSEDGAGADARAHSPRPATPPAPARPPARSRAASDSAALAALAGSQLPPPPPYSESASPPRPPAKGPLSRSAPAPSGAPSPSAARRVDLPGLPALTRTMSDVGSSVARSALAHVDSLQDMYDAGAHSAAHYAEAASTLAVSAMDVVLGMLLLNIEMSWAAAKAAGSAVWSAGSALASAESRLPPSPSLVQSLQNTFSQLVIESAVIAGVWAKRSPFPDYFAAAPERFLAAYARLDADYGVQQFTVDLTQWLMRWSVWLTSVLATAGVKGALAFQRTPGWRDRDVVRRRREREQRERREAQADRHRRRARRARPRPASPSDPSAHAPRSPPPSPPRWSRAFSSSLAHLAGAPLDPSAPVALDVGGRRFATSLSTLRRAPPSSRLAALSSDAALRRSGAADGGALFVDRDARAFRRVLNHLRGADAAAGVEDAGELAELRDEAEWYGLPDLAARASELLAERARAKERSASPLGRASSLLRGAVGYLGAGAAAK